MRIFIVRDGETKRGIGVFACSTIDELAWIVDEETDALGCEYSCLSKSGGFFFRDTEPDFGVSDRLGDGDEYTEDETDGSGNGWSVSPSENWWEPFFAAGDKCRWLPLPRSKLFERALAADPHFQD